MSTGPWFVYLLTTGNGMLYTGITTDVTRRLAQHQGGTGAKALRGKGPLTMVFCCPAGERGAALRWEYRIKQLSRAQKQQLVALAAPLMPASLESLWSILRPDDKLA